jgi:hypothetical protein
MSKGFCAYWIPSTAGSSSRLFTDESQLQMRRREIPQWRKFEIVVVSPREIRRVVAASTRVVLNHGTEPEYEVRA